METVCLGPENVTFPTAVNMTLPTTVNVQVDNYAYATFPASAEHVQTLYFFYSGNL